LKLKVLQAFTHDDRTQVERENAMIQAELHLKRITLERKRD
jgi:hypothetical protein